MKLKRYNKIFEREEFLTKLHNGILQGKIHFIMAIPLTFKKYTKIKSGVKSLKNKLCYFNSILMVKENPELKMVVGFVIDQKEYKELLSINFQTYPYSAFGFSANDHAWVVNEKNEIIDCTYGSNEAKDSVYFGIEVPTTLVKSTEPENDIKIRYDWFYNKIVNPYIDKVEKELDRLGIFE